MFCISLLLSKKSCQQSHPYQVAGVGFTAEYHLQLLLLRLPKL
jgi:hypothetical protein